MAAPNERMSPLLRDIEAALIIEAAFARREREGNPQLAIDGRVTSIASSCFQCLGFLYDKTIGNILRGDIPTLMATKGLFISMAGVYFQSMGGFIIGSALGFAPLIVYIRHMWRHGIHGPLPLDARFQGPYH